MAGRYAFLALGLVSALTGPAEAQVRAGGEFTINTAFGPDPLAPDVSIGGDGSFIVAWHRYQGPNVSARRFDVTGVPRGDEFILGPSGDQYGFPSAKVAADARGGFAVSWTGPDGSYGGIFGRRYLASGQPAGPAFMANTYTTKDQMHSSVAMAADGSFVVVWDDTGFPNSPVRGLFAQRYDSEARPLGANMLVDNDGSVPVVTRTPAGPYVVAWLDFDGVRARRFDAQGAPQGPPIAVDPPTSVAAAGLDMAADADGNFVVAWTRVIVFPDFDVYARRYAADGTPRGDAFRVNAFNTAAQSAPSVALDANGNFVVVWRTQTESPSRLQVKGRRFAADGTPRGDEFTVPSFSAGTHTSPAVASDRNGNFIVTWDSFNNVRGQRFGGMRAAALSVDAAGNGVLEAGETVSVAPAWRNVNGAAQAIGGAARSFSGPGAAGDPVYTLTDATADYGTVADASTADCDDTGNCYAAGVSVPTSRPAVHWDARLREEITPSGFGQSQTWLLHVGESFQDVPRGHAFYRYVETMLHAGVTAGCAAGTYCPEATTAREGMAVFVLVAREGRFYSPPACGTPMFSDVPPSSPFCRWIEELARRGVTGGCGGGRFCPSEAVTREQMAVFVLRTLDGALSPPACAPPNLFDDVPETSPYCPWIEELARRGVVAGCDGRNYCPERPVTRAETSVFITGAFGLTLYGP